MGRLGRPDLGRVSGRQPRPRGHQTPRPSQLPFFSKNLPWPGIEPWALCQPPFCTILVKCAANSASVTFRCPKVGRRALSRPEKIKSGHKKIYLTLYDRNFAAIHFCAVKSREMLQKSLNKKNAPWAGGSAHGPLQSRRQATVQSRNVGNGQIKPNDDH